MNLPKGYKMTEVGVIPEDWEVKKLGDIAEIISGGTPKTNVPEYWNGSIKWCTPTDITKCSGKYLFETDRTISSKGLVNSSAKLLPIGTLLLCSRATIGEIRIAAVEISTNQGFKSLVCKSEVSNEFLYYKLLTMKSVMLEKAIGSTFLELAKKEVASLEIDLPPLPEQQAIARVLSDTDALINALDKLIAKKRDIKKAVMQELLTGKTRLPGFSGEWEVKSWGT
jgi:type I restriction enzyme S subunit